jgi:uncharacterized protein
MILDQFKSKLVEYMKSGDVERLGVLRYFLSKVKNREIELRPQNQVLTDEIVYKVLKKQIKQINETIEMCEQAKRPEALDKAKKELVILEEFKQVFPVELREEQSTIR